MKANELRVGNYIQQIDQKSEFEFLQVVYGINNESVWIHCNEESDVIDYLEAIPIPLTEEWLVKFGWQYFNGKTSGTLTKDTDVKLDIDFYKGKLQVKSHYEGEHMYRILPVKYVHQLQNLYFALTGEELKLKE